jgi:hypothetical protein
MASSNGIANEQMVHLITQQTIDLLATMKTDISQAKSLTETDRKSCEAICQRAETEYNRLKMDFLQETLTLIDQALNTSDQQILQQIHCAWSLQLDHVTHQCERIACPLVEMLQMLSQSDEKIGKKYWFFLGGAVVSILLIGTAFGFFIACYYPLSLVQLVGKGIFVMGAGALATTAIAANCKTICMPQDDVCTNEATRLILDKRFVNYWNSETQDSSTSEWATRMKRTIVTLNITEDMWQNREVLESIKTFAEGQFKSLQNST